ncbi:helix-turn-helix domain-containing protein [Seohaeicola zhoushanensis]|uniref:Transcriptional regulator n=1 Tax=Seohaeicola zhoushanensis TaxID=1569283 RepID=A0A8J3MA30_9RHOB|nr:helix-turn-helix domain-containing protein [Seohaeicola zhoushanensis]GHF66129.1 transcriptional regulator [Seohaeicola zhoushanensis]
MPDETGDWFAEDVATFGDRISGAREAAGMTQAELARRLGVNKTTLAAWEDDRSDPRANRLAMLAGMLNVSVSWLLTGKGDGVPAPGDRPSPDREAREVITELRGLREAMRATAERADKLEARLDKLLEAQDNW